MSKVWVVTEWTREGPLGVSLELLTLARELAEEVCAVGFGEDPSAQAEVYGSYGAGKLFYVAGVGDNLPGPPLSKAMADRISSGDIPQVILLASTYDGRDIAARLSVKLDRPVLTNVVGLTQKEGKLYSSHAVFGGTQIVTATITAPPPAIFVVRPKSATAVPSSGGPAEIEELPFGELGATGAAKVVSRHIEEASGPKLDDASVVVSGGRGLGQKESYAMIEELAKLLHAAPAASRAVVDAGWVPYSYQVGQTGKIVKPDLYIACGISGATQHLVGMKGSKKIVAINKDPEAPIFQVADLGIVGDVHKVLPKLIEALSNR